MNKYTKSYELFESISKNNADLIVVFNDIIIGWNHTYEHDMLTRIAGRAKLNLVDFNNKFIKLLELIKKQNLEKNKIYGIYFFRSKFKLLFFVKSVSPLSIIVTTILDKDMDVKEIHEIFFLNETFSSGSRYNVQDQENNTMATANNLQFIKTHYTSCYKNDLDLYAPISIIIDSYIEDSNLDSIEENELRSTIDSFTEFMNKSNIDDVSRPLFKDIWSQFEDEMSFTHK